MPDSPQLKSTFDHIKSIALYTILISILGYADYITGEISLDVLYMFCLCVATWYTSTLIGLFFVIEIMFAKVTADYYDNIKIVSHVYEWNAASFFIMYLVVCILVSKVKKLLSK